MHLSIHSLNKTLFDSDAEKIIAKTTVGELTILDNHIPLLVPLISGLLRIGVKSESAQGGVHAETTFPISSGFLEVKPKGDVVILAHVAE